MDLSGRVPVVGFLFIVTLSCLSPPGQAQQQPGLGPPSSSSPTSVVATLVPYWPAPEIGPAWAAMHLAAAHINSRNSSLSDAQAKLPPWFQIELAPYNTNFNVDTALDAAYDAISVGGAEVLIGPAVSSTVIPAAVVSRMLRVPQLSPTATAITLADKSKYPYFMRTIPSDAVSATAFVSVVARYGWNDFALVRLDDEYGDSMASYMSLDAKSAGLTMLDVAFTPESTESIVEALSTVRQSQSNIIVVLIPWRSDVATILSEALSLGMVGRGYVWIMEATELLTQSDIPLHLLQGAIAVRPLLVDSSAGEHSSPRAGRGPLHEALFSTPPEDFLPPHLVGAFQVAKDYHHGKVDINSYACYAYDAIWTAALGLAAAKEQAGGSTSRPSGEEVLAAMLAASFNGSSGTVAFTPQGERNSSTLQHALEFMNVTLSEDGEVSDASWEVSLYFADTAPPLSEEEPGSLVAPIIWPDYTTNVPVIALSCKQGMVFDPETSSCVYHVAVAVSHMFELSLTRVVAGAYMAALHINTRDSSVVSAAAGLPQGFRLKLSHSNSKYSPAGGVEAGLAAYEANAIAAMGTLRSSSCIPFSNILHYSKTPVVSPACTSQSLGSLEGFPYFARTIPAVAESARVTATTMIAGFGWHRIGVLYANDDYGSSFQQQFSLAGSRIAAQLGLGQSVQISGAALEPGTFQSTLTEMKAGGYKIFVLVLLEDQFEFLETASRLGMIGKGYTYVTGEADLMHVDGDVPQPDGSVMRASTLAQGFLRMVFDPRREPQYGILDAATKANGAEAVDDSFLQMLESNGLNVEEYFAGGLLGDRFSVYAYDAIWAIALGLAKAEREVDGWLMETCEASVNCHGDQLAQKIRELSFEGAGGRVEFLRQEHPGQLVHTGNRNVSDVSSPIFYWNSSMHSWERAGEFVQQRDLPLGGYLELEAPIIWPGFSHAVPADGSGCAASTFYNETTELCEDCRPGTYTYSYGMITCIPCSPGHFCASSKCTSCDSCDVYQYQDQPGQQQCKSCPANTISETRAATEVTECLCKEGFYRRDGQPGKECFSCPNGGVCDGGVHAPYPGNGYWGDWGLVDKTIPDSTEASNVNLQAIHRIAFHKCSNDHWCTSDSCDKYGTLAAQEVSGADTQLGDVADGGEGLVFLASRQRLCRTNVSELCGNAHDGRMCQSCSEGHFALGDKCLTCLAPSGVFVGGVILGIVVIWYLLNNVMASTYNAVDIMLIFFQNASTISNFSLNWSSVLVEYPFWLLAIVNFDVTFISPQCTWGSWSYGHGLVLQLVLPIIIAIVSLASYGCNYWIIRCFARVPPRYHRPPSSASGESPRREPRVLGRVATLCRAIRFARCRSELKKHLDSYIAATASFINVVYHTMTLKCLEVLICMDLPDGSEFLRAGPSVACWEGVHLGFVVMSFLGLVVYTIGVPLSFYVILKYGQVHNLFRDERFMRQWGWLYLRYEKEWFWWEIVIMARRALLVLVLVCTKAVPSVQLVLGIVLVTSLITSHFFARPFLSVALDYLDTVSLVSLMGLLCTGALFYDSYGRETYGNWDLVVNCIAFLLLIGCVVLVLVMVYHDIRREEQLKVAAKKLRRSILEVVQPSRQNQGRISDFMKSIPVKVRRMSAAPSTLDTSESKEQSKMDHKVNTGLLMQLQEEPLELSRTISLTYVHNWLKDMSLTGVGTTPENAPDAELAVDHSGSLINFWLVNHWTKDVMSDKSPVSYYSQRAHSLFFGMMTEQNPFLIDYLLFASPPELQRAKAVLQEIRQAHVKYSEQGQIAKMVTTVDRGPLLAWLLSARTENIDRARDLLVEMYQASHDGQHPGAWRLSASFSRANRVAGVVDAILGKLPAPERFGMSDGRQLQRRPPARGKLAAQHAELPSPTPPETDGTSDPNSACQGHAPDTAPLLLPGQATYGEETIPTDSHMKDVKGSPVVTEAGGAGDKGKLQENMASLPRQRTSRTLRSMSGLAQFDAELQRLSNLDSELTSHLLNLNPTQSSSDLLLPHLVSSPPDGQSSKSP